MTTHRQQYLKNYKQQYKQNKKIVTFPLLLGDYQVLYDRATHIELSPNKLAKELILAYLSNKQRSFLSKEEKKVIQEYIHISRGIANNINQIAYKSNIGEVIDINILINSLKHYENEFKALIIKLKNNDKQK
jgi:hypothetical protein